MTKRYQHPSMDHLPPCDPARESCCYHIAVARNVVKKNGQHGGVEAADFINRPAGEAKAIQHDFGPGSHAARREGWKIMKVTPMRCLSRSLEGARRRKRR